MTDASVLRRPTMCWLKPGDLFTLPKDWGKRAVAYILIDEERVTTHAGYPVYHHYTFVVRGMLATYSSSWVRRHMKWIT